jgi:Raf kinase inhibitor-like YbhB/YbcL family protein
MAFTLQSPDIANAQRIAQPFLKDGWGQSGEDKSPALTWTDPPEGTKSFVVTCYDPDAPTGSGFWHWVVFNIPGDATGLPQGIGKDGSGLPAGAVQSRTDFGDPGYGGPAPPQGHGDHRYIFTVHALKVDKLDLTPETSAAVVGFNCHFQALATASITPVYGW